MKLNRIHIIDDEPVIRESISGWLSKKYEVLSFACAEDYLDAVQKMDPNDKADTCILLDFQMLGINGVELQNKLKQLNHQYPIIFMSGNAHQSDVIDAWHGGAIDFLLKPFSPTKMNEVLERQFNLMKDGLESSTTLTSHQEEITPPITRREAQVLLLLGNGKSQLEVAHNLGISLSTVKMYRTFLKDKLALNSLTELIRYCDSHQKSIEKIASQ